MNDNNQIYPPSRALSTENMKALELAIAEIIFDKGIKATSMDSIASSLKMSKRTLYEIFNSKEEMILRALYAMHKRMGERNLEIFNTSSNVVEALMLGFKNHRDVILKIQDNFFQEMEEMYPHAHREGEKSRNTYLRNFVDVLVKGVKEGFFRPDFNYDLSVRLLTLQMESMKRAPDLFPEGLSILELYDTVVNMFMRGICTDKGLEILEKTKI